MLDPRKVRLYTYLYKSGKIEYSQIPEAYQAVIPEVISEE